MGKYKLLQKEYSIGQISKDLNIPVDTLRYYEKTEITPTIIRDKNGYRVYTEADKKWLGFVNCLKSTGMPLGKIKEYLKHMENRDETVFLRRKLMVEHRDKLRDEIEILQGYLDRINHKVEFYDELIKNHGLDELDVVL